MPEQESSSQEFLPENIRNLISNHHHNNDNSGTPSKTPFLVSTIFLTIITAAFLGLCSYFYYLHKRPSQQSLHCQRPVVNNLIHAANKLEKQNLIKHINRLMLGYPMVHSQDEQDICKDTPFYTVNYDIKEEGKAKSLSISITHVDENKDAENRDKNHDNAMIWSKTYHFDKYVDDQSLDLLLAKAAYNLFSYDGVIANFALQEHWGNDQWKSHYHCRNNIYHNYLKQPDKYEDNYYQCVASIVKDGSMYADDYAQYAMLLSLKKMGYATFRVMDNMPSYEEATKMAEQINPYDPDVLLLKLIYYRYRTKPDLRAMLRLAEIVENRYLLHPHLLIEIAKIQGLYFGEWHLAMHYAQLAERLSDEKSHDYFTLSMYIVNKDWKNAHILLSNNHILTSNMAGFFTLLTGAENNDDRMVEQGLDILYERGIHDKDDAIAYIKRRDLHNSITAILLNGIEKHYPKQDGD